MSAHRKRKALTTLFDFLEIGIISTTIFLIIYLFVGQLLIVTGDSMIPTFYDNEQVLAEKLSIRFKPLERGDIVIFRHPEKNKRLLIKRVVGMPFDTYKIANGKVFINGNIVDEPYLSNGAITSGDKYYRENTEYTIPRHSYVLLGDNREKSSDSRNFGPVREELIVGRAVMVYYPFSSFRVL